MEFPAQLVMFGLPALGYALFSRCRGRSWRRIISELGWRRSDRKYYGYALLAAGFLAAVLYFSSNLVIPSDLSERPVLGTSYYTELKFGLSTVLLAMLRESVYVALGEEVFFSRLAGRMVDKPFRLPRRQRVPDAGLSSTPPAAACGRDGSVAPSPTTAVGGMATGLVEAPFWEHLAGLTGSRPDQHPRRHHRCVPLTVRT